MIVDTSAIVAIVRSEPEQAVFLQRLNEARRAGEPTRMSAATLIELTIVIDRFRDARASQLLDALLDELRLDIVPVGRDLVALARTANRRFGKGFHPAKLNMGDCFAYALAMATREPLLFKGEDFSRTDLISAV